MQTNDVYTVLSVFEEKQCHLIEEYYPHTFNDIKELMLWTHSFDKTVAILKAMDERELAKECEEEKPKNKKLIYGHVW